MSSNKRANRATALKKLQQFRKRWAGHEGADTAYGHILVGSKDNGAVKQRKKATPEKRPHSAEAED